ncbi:alpha/beta hydrolase [Streptomyces spiroverticillatus]|uniref:Alpha/beta hydrolase n=1 Tax=Streptomyces finlayi TaxID=67296 RepID=A0A918WZT7_9ACTN|nr:alpha/beta hydrolase [Streptomyces finlayi]GHA17144.1 alpha/beta hydrolase [Streptomyces spiroverticillatus]GHC99150.1 alpha/beta hydrolase [Streptomyces finlayi]
MKLTRPRTTLAVGATAAAAVVALATLAPSASATQEQTAAPAHRAKPTVVLVHGAFADASGWADTVKRLRHDGYPVRAVANPLRGLDHDAAYVTGLLKSIKGPKIVVGHSYGGAVITNAAASVPDVKALVYVAAFVPDQGESLGSLLEEHADPTVPALPQQTFGYTRPDGSAGTDVLLDPARFRAAFAADVPAPEADLMAASQRPIAVEAFEQPTKAAAWKKLPSWALVATRDKAIPPSLERFMARRAGAHITEVPSSHAAMVSNPGAVTRLVQQADRATR